MLQGDAPTPVAPVAEARRRRQLIVLTIVCVLAGLAYGAYWMLIARFRVSTDNAYVHGNVVQITPQIEGTIVAIEANDTEQVEQGQMLLQLGCMQAQGYCIARPMPLDGFIQWINLWEPPASWQRLRPL